ncbi:MAG: DUF1802 family protein [Actinomycetota bacterium]
MCTVVILARMTGAVPNGATEAAGMPGLKEWAVIVHALLAGEQIVDIRKGGLREDGRRFSVPTDRCWLSPTVEHQDTTLLAPAYAHRIELASGSPVGGPVTVPGWAEIVDTAIVTETEQVEAVATKSIWSRDYVVSRFRWKRRDPLTVLALRVHVLEEPITIPWRDSYGGCTSWVDYDALPADLAAVGSRPALSDEAFAARLAGVRAALPTECWTGPPEPR